MTRKAGSIVLTRLRERIRLGRYFGRWGPGDRLPSVRAVAQLEDVDRKTVAAAYRRLAEEGLVRVEARSGVYLSQDGSPEADPLRRLHLSWLEHAMASAEELGLDLTTANRMFQGVTAVQRRRIPVVDPDQAHAALLAHELSARTGLDCVATEARRLPAEVGPLHDPPFILATPEGRELLSAMREQVPVILITLAADLFESVYRAAREESVVVVVGDGTLRKELEHAVDRGLFDQPERVQVVAAESWGGRTVPGRERVVTWLAAAENNGEQTGAPRPGRSVAAGGPSTHLVSTSTLGAIRSQVARAALDQVSTSSASATRRRPAG